LTPKDRRVFQRRWLAARRENTSLPSKHKEIHSRQKFPGKSLSDVSPLLHREWKGKSLVDRISNGILEACPPRRNWPYFFVKTWWVPRGHIHLVRTEGEATRRHGMSVKASSRNTAPGGLNSRPPATKPHWHLTASAPHGLYIKSK
jgi:hypothetical protein